MGDIGISQILRLKSSVFTINELALASNEGSTQRLKRRLNYYVKQGELYNIRRGIYAKDKDYDRRELATKIFTPSYISFETVLFDAGIIFQFYTTIFVASYQTREIMCDEQAYSYRKIRDEILTNLAGIENHGTYFIASQERAFLDILYLNAGYYFDNLMPLDFDKIFSLLPMYDNQRMNKEVKRLFELVTKERQNS